MPLIFWTDKLLFRYDKLALSLDCCCVECLCQYVVFYITDYSGSPVQDPLEGFHEPDFDWDLIWFGSNDSVIGNGYIWIYQVCYGFGLDVATEADDALIEMKSQMPNTPAITYDTGRFPRGCLDWEQMVTDELELLCYLDECEQEQIAGQSEYTYASCCD